MATYVTLKTVPALPEGDLPENAVVVSESGTMAQQGGAGVDMDSLPDSDTFVKATVKSNADDGKTAHTETSVYRTDSAPTNNPAPSTITHTTNTDGSVNINIPWGIYSQGAKKANALVLFWKTGTSSGLGAPTAGDEAVVFNVAPNSPSSFTLEGVPADKYYSFGIAALAYTESGDQLGDIQSPTATPDWQDYQPSATVNFTGQLDGTAASTVKTQASNADTDLNTIVAGTRGAGAGVKAQKLIAADDTTPLIDASDQITTGLKTSTGNALSTVADNAETDLGNLLSARGAAPKVKSSKLYTDDGASGLISSAGVVQSGLTTESGNAVGTTVDAADTDLDVIVAGTRGAASGLKAQKVLAADDTTPLIDASDQITTDLKTATGNTLSTVADNAETDLSSMLQTRGSSPKIKVSKVYKDDGSDQLINSTGVVQSGLVTESGNVVGEVADNADYDLNAMLSNRGGGPKIKASKLYTDDGAGALLEADGKVTPSLLTESGNAVGTSADAANIGLDLVTGRIKQNAPLAYAVAEVPGIDTSTGKVDPAVEMSDGSTIFPDTGGTISGDVTITGNLTVQGTQFISETETVQVEDNVIVLNYGETGGGVTAGTAGIEIERGTLTNYQFLFDESDDTFKIGLIGSLQKVATREDTPTDNALLTWDDATSKLVTDSNLTWDGSTLLATGTIESTTTVKVGTTLGIGTDATSNLVEVKGSVSTVAKFVSTIASGSSAGAVIAVYTDDGAALANTHRLGTQIFGGAEDTSNTLNVSAEIGAYATEDWSGTNNGAEVQVWTTPNASTSRALAFTIGQDKLAKSEGAVESTTTMKVGTILGLGVDPVSNAAVKLGGTITASSGSASGIFLDNDLTSAANGDLLSHIIVAGATYQTNTHTGLTAAQIRLAGSNMFKGGTGTIDNAAALLIVNAPTAGTNNYSLFVDAGDSRFDGAIYLDQYIYHQGDTDTYIQMIDDRILLYAGGNEILDYEESATTSTLQIDYSGKADITFGNGNVFFGGEQGSYDGKVGIGTTIPGKLLTLNQVTGGVGILLEGNGTDVGMLEVASAGVNHQLKFGTISNNEIAFYTANTEKMRLVNTGDLVIGTGSANERLHIGGTNPRIYLADATAPGTTTNRLYSVSGALYWNGTDLTTGGALPAGTEGQTLRSNAGTWAATSLLFVKSTGEVGVGTATPGSMLHILGDTADESLLKVEGTNGVLFEIFDTVTGTLFAVNDGSGIPILQVDADDTVLLAPYSTTPLVGIGTTSPEGALHIYSGSAGTVTAHTDSDELIIESSGDGGISILTPDSSNGKLVFGSPSDNQAARIRNVQSTGIFAIETVQTSGEIAFGTGASGIEAIRIDSSQNVGIGTSSPSNLLHLNTSSNGAGIEIKNGATVVTRLFRETGDESTIEMFDGGSRKNNIRAGGNSYFTGGNVGIGTTSPEQILNIVDTSNPSADGSVIIEGRRDGSANLLALRSRDASSPTTALPANHGPIIRFQGYDGTAFGDMAAITVNSESTLSASNHGGVLKFYTVDDGTTTLDERVRIDHNGNVGIGLVDPTVALHIKGAITNGAQIILTSTTTDAALKDTRIGAQHYTNDEEPLALIAGRVDVSTARVMIGGGRAEENAATAIEFYTAANHTTTTGTSRMAIDSSGQVVIGSGTQSALLTINNGVAGVNLKVFGDSTYRGSFIVDTNDIFNIYNYTEGGSTIGDLQLGNISGSAGIYYVGATDRVGIGIAAPSFKLEVNGSFAATTKSFIIDHPTKDNMRLVHGVLEGPEFAVYFRGELNGADVIDLPDYWTGLVHEDSITVNLTPIGSYQKLYVDEIYNNRIYIGQAGFRKKRVHCHYTVTAMRKDVDKLIVEMPLA